MAQRAAFNSRVGFIMAAVGSAVGLGNLWRFPYLVSNNGGAAFLAIYLVFLFLIGIPALFAELSIGRKSGKNAVDAFDNGGRAFGWLGYLFIVTTVLLLSYYSVIAGWSLRYMFTAFTAPYFDNASQHFGEIAVGPGAILFHALFMFFTMVILSRGVSRGIEKANLIMMPILFASVIALTIYGLTREGAAAGVSYYTSPDFSPYKQDFNAVAKLLSDTAGQTFFSIGLGLGAMLTYASYINRDTDLQNTGLTIGFADTGVAVLAGFMVFPLIFSLGLESIIASNTSSAGGLFIALPTAFAEIGGTLGGVFAGGFFILLSFAALSSALSLLEVPVSYVLDRRPEWGRRRVVLLLGMSVYLLGVPSAIWLEWLDFADRLVSSVLLLLGGFMMTIYVGWIRPEVLEELKVGRKGFDLSKIFIPLIRYVLPVLLAILLVFGISTFIQSF